jgi:hypothetical protein
MAGIARTVTTFTAAVLVLAANTADAAFTTGACLAQKRVVWGTLRKCQATEEAKLLKGKSADLAACQTKLQTALAKITTKATKGGIACRYRDNGDSTITDFDSGLMWEKKNAGNVNATFAWTAALKDFPEGYNACVTSDGSTLVCNSLYHDWRLPNVVELRSIVDVGAAGCGSGSPCIDPIFGPTIASYYWSATSDATDSGSAWYVYFNDPNVYVGSSMGKNYYVRAVRTGL